MRSSQLLVLMLLVTAPCFQSLCLADTVEICNATASANGNTFSIPCLTTSSEAFALLAAGGNSLTVDLVDAAVGTTATVAPGAEICLSLDWEASINGTFEVTGGSGNGEIVLMGQSDAGNFSEGFGFNGVPLSGQFNSNFLPEPWPYPGYPFPIDVPFTFGVPFNLYADAILTAKWSTPFSSGYLGWEASWQWSLLSTSILDSNGNPVADPRISSVAVPEPSTIAMALLMLAALATQLCLRNTSARAQTKKL